MSSELIEFSQEINKIVPSIWREVTRRQLNHPAWGRLSVPQMLILEVLYRHGRCIMRQLAERLSISTPAVTGLVDRMVKSGYIERVRDKKDRRVINIDLTSQGAKVAKGVSTSRQKMIQDIFGRLSSSERKAYLNILRKVFANIKTKTGK